MAVRNQKSPKDGATRQAKYREQQKKLGRRGRLYYLTDAEKQAVDLFLQGLRESPPPPPDPRPNR